MAGCSSCGHRKAQPRVKNVSIARESSTKTAEELIVKKSDSPKLVQLRYYGGGMTRQTSGCSSCGSQGRYALTTSEVISFASDDAPSGWFSQRFDVGKDVFVTEKQAERLLEETFTNPAGQVVHKFKVIE